MSNPHKDRRALNNLSYGSAIIAIILLYLFLNGCAISASDEQINLMADLTAVCEENEIVYQRAYISDDQVVAEVWCWIIELNYQQLYIYSQRADEPLKVQDPAFGWPGDGVDQQCTGKYLGYRTSNIQDPGPLYPNPHTVDARHWPRPDADVSGHERISVIYHYYCVIDNQLMVRRESDVALNEGMVFEYYPKTNSDYLGL